MGKRDLNYTIKSSSFAESKQVKIDGEVILDMTGDPRLDKLLEQVKEDIAKNGWKVPENEKEITDRTTELMHSDEHYGGYSEESSEIQGRHGEAVARLTQAKLDLEFNVDNVHRGLTDAQKVEEKAKLREEIAELEEKIPKIKAELEADTGDLNSRPLRDVPVGETVCFQQAAVMGYVMENVGLKNDMVIGVGHVVEGGGGHAFVQSREGRRNIIDPTTVETGVSYWYNRNGADMRDSEVFLGSESPDDKAGSRLMDYGGGKIPGFFGKLFPNERLVDMIEENQPETAQEAIETIIHANREVAGSKLQDKEERGSNFRAAFSRLEATEVRFLDGVKEDLAKDGDLSKADKQILKDLKEQLKEKGVQYETMSDYYEAKPTSVSNEESQSVQPSK